MARAHGARAQMALAFETVYGTAPTTGFRTVPFASTTLGAEQPLIASELLGQGRDPLAPIKDAVTADGDVVVPIDVENFGLWLKAAFGAPVTSGTTPKTHTFQSGNWTLPSLAIETAMPEVPRYAMYTGCVCDQLSWQMGRSGLLTATARLVAQGESVFKWDGIGNDGRSMPAHLTRSPWSSGGRGLVGIAEHCELSGGSLRMRTADAGGTVLRATLGAET